MKNIFYILMSILFIACQAKEKNFEKGLDTKKIIINDWDSIQTSKLLIVLAENSPSSFFLYRGKKLGCEYELLHEFAKDMGIRLQIKMMHDLDSMEIKLNRNEGHLIACNLTQTKERASKFNFSIPFLTSHQVLVQRLPNNWRKLTKKALKDSLITDISQLKNKRIFVWKNSSYYKTITDLNTKHNLHLQIIPADGDITSEELIKMVSEKDIDYTITDENVAKINLNFYRNINIDLALSKDESIVFAGKYGDKNQLIDTLNYWLKDKKNQSTIGEVKRKYYKRKNLTKKAINEYSSVTESSQLSPYDAIIKEESKKIGWDWRLVSAIVYQESKFETWKESWAGAYGLFQFMPSTANGYGITKASSAKAQLRAGIKKLNKNYTQWLEVIPDSTEAIYFTLATFNAGRCHVDDARILAKQNGKNINVWFENVDSMMLNLSKPKYYRNKELNCGRMRGIETFEYVYEVFERYEEYKHAYPIDMKNTSK